MAIDKKYLNFMYFGGLVISAAIQLWLLFY